MHRYQSIERLCQNWRPHCWRPARRNSDGKLYSCPCKYLLFQETCRGNEIPGHFQVTYQPPPYLFSSNIILIFLQQTASIFGKWRISNPTPNWMCLRCYQQHSSSCRQSTTSVQSWSHRHSESHWNWTRGHKCCMCEPQCVLSFLITTVTPIYSDHASHALQNISNAVSRNILLSFISHSNPNHRHSELFSQIANDNFYDAQAPQQLIS